MATQIVTGNRVFANPEIDGGQFYAPNPVQNVIIATRFYSPQSILVGAIASAGVFPTAAEVPISIFQSVQSSGGFIASGSLVAGTNYGWIAVGVGG